jgi:small nuclear ribonucleoprotein (snRNP)-like protein
MKKLLLFCFLFLVFTLKLNAQDKYLELIKNQTGRTLKIKEDKRVVVKTKDRKRFVGKIKFVDSLHIQLENSVIHLDSVSFIKKRSTVGIISRSVSMYVGSNLFAIGIIALPTGIGVIISVVVLPPSIPLLIYAINSNKRRSETWKYKIVFK